MGKRVKNNSGFTLIEMLIVVILLGILAMLIIPQVGVSTEDAKLNTLQTNVQGLRNAVELYYAQHGEYPGAKKQTDGAAVASDAEAEAAFVPQLTQYTDGDGKVSATKNSTYKYGPYLKTTTLPANPYNSASSIKCDYDQTDITDRTTTNNTGYMFHPKTGVIFPNDSADHSGL
jgi:prepilin-type N-terminal cleavage/methylation domain-containing protein